MEERCGIWRLEQLLAVGGIGEVWRASGFPAAGGAGAGADEDRDQDVLVAAVKRLHTHLLRHEAVLAMFENERKVLLELPPHPGLVHGIDASSPSIAQGSRPWVAMQLVEGLDLRRFLDGGAAERGTAPEPRPLAPAIALPLMAKVCDAVAHLHAHGWVHGDVVPSNLLVDDALAQVKLCDFGVARPSGGGGPVQGTHAYMAPEQVRGEAWTPATDVFALGVVLWELVSGKRLFHRGPPWLSMQAILEQDAPPLADRALDALVRAALARDPGARLPDALALGRRLEACGGVFSS